jgi:O-antigen ligase
MTRKRALPFAAAALLGILVLALTQSRGSWLAFIAGAGVTALPLIPAGGRRRIFGPFYIPATAAALLVAYVILVGPRKLMSSALELAASLVGRTKLWAFGLRLVGEHALERGHRNPV